MTDCSLWFAAKRLHFLSHISPAHIVEDHALGVRRTHSKRPSLLMAVGGGHLTHFYTLPASPTPTKFDGVAASISSGRIVFAPANSEYVHVFNPVQPESSMNVYVGAALAGKQYKFSGACAVGGRVYMAPYSSEAVGVLDIASGTLSTISTGDSTPYKYSGIVRSSTTGKLYLPPHDADAVGVVDMATAAFSTLPLPATVGTTSARFSGALKLQAGGEERVLMVPYSATVALALDPASESVTTVPLSASAAGGSGKFMGGAVVGASAYLAPFNQHLIGIVTARSDGSFAF